ncbi:hypothetical protein M9H77_29452 [Catharanthus roseus]|uniref:Uncharacterized protein n=1 Tax=Catharanthus roseus TaxID=4058 RepID=A0ACB9ZWB7_CATRO|nr:hypothetical protein M9H77_29452 [Catharanthus roseus]
MNPTAHGKVHLPSTVGSWPGKRKCYLPPTIDSLYGRWKGFGRISTSEVQPIVHGGVRPTVNAIEHNIEFRIYLKEKPIKWGILGLTFMAKDGSNRKTRDSLFQDCKRKV